MTQNPIIPETPSAEEYGADADQGSVFTSRDPYQLFEEWLTLAKKHEINDPNAMSLATVDQHRMPDVRMVLLKDLSGKGFSFYTNNDSAKGEQLAANQKAALCFHWKSIRRQVRVRGTVDLMSNQESDAYFAKRSRGSKIGAWASKQSHMLEEQGALEARVKEFDAKFGDDVPRPPNWQGYVVDPLEIEFWVNRPFRLHDRLVFARQPKGWVTGRLYP